eukprot:TRINITY_DN29891_c0_g1_i3.p1 TRINITY_DN29891_c0_g1~~TRINITY_DN29891_c0_g1_i3.p1  ORF type:complete len:664 (-),score=102.37 TRINITY_DN29891_c0_g1_i3:228-2219(-)
MSQESPVKSAEQQVHDSDEQQPREGSDWRQAEDYKLDSHEGLAKLAAAISNMHTSNNVVAEKLQTLQKEEQLVAYLVVFMDANPRRINRLLNTFTVAKRLDKDLPLAKLLKMLILFEQWPYRASWLTQVIEDDAQQGAKHTEPLPGYVKDDMEEGEATDWMEWSPRSSFVTVASDQTKATQLPDNMPLSELFAAIEEYIWDPSLWETSHDQLYSDRLCVLSTDSDPEVFDSLLRVPPRLTVADLRPDSLLLRATINRNVALEKKVSFQAGQRIKWKGPNGEVKYKRRTELLIAGYLQRKEREHGEGHFDATLERPLGAELDVRQRVTFQAKRYGMPGGHTVTPVKGGHGGSRVKVEVGCGGDASGANHDSKGNEYDMCASEAEIRFSTRSSQRASSYGQTSECDGSEHDDDLDCHQSPQSPPNAKTSEPNRTNAAGDESDVLSRVSGGSAVLRHSERTRRSSRKSECEDDHGVARHQVDAFDAEKSGSSCASTVGSESGMLSRFSSGNATPHSSETSRRSYDEDAKPSPGYLAYSASRWSDSMGRSGKRTSVQKQSSACEGDGDEELLPRDDQHCRNTFQSSVDGFCLADTIGKRSDMQSEIRNGSEDPRPSKSPHRSERKSSTTRPSRMKSNLARNQEDDDIRPSSLDRLILNGEICTQSRR